jgi:hypothetical protein
VVPPATCWRRLIEWAKVGVFDQLHLEVLDRLGVDGELEWSRASVDTMSVRAKCGGIMLAQIPPIAAAPPGLRRQWPAADGRGDGGQRQRQHHVRGADRRRAGGAHPQRSAALPARHRPRGQGYDARHCPAYLRRRGINARIARRGIESSKRLGRYRWRVERRCRG